MRRFLMSIVGVFAVCGTLFAANQPTKTLHCAALAQELGSFDQKASVQFDVPEEYGEVPAGPAKAIDEFQVTVGATTSPFYGEDVNVGITYGNGHSAGTANKGPFAANRSVLNLVVSDPDGKRMLSLECAYDYQPEYSAPLLPPVVH